MRNSHADYVYILDVWMNDSSVFLTHGICIHVFCMRIVLKNGCLLILSGSFRNYSATFFSCKLNASLILFSCMYCAGIPVVWFFSLHEFLPHLELTFESSLSTYECKKTASMWHLLWHAGKSSGKNFDDVLLCVL